MEQKLRENINLLIQDGKKFEKINFSILLSWNRNTFFSHLGNYIAFYNQTLRATQKHKKINLPELHFENYSLHPFVQFIFLFSLPLSSIILMFQWTYVREIISHTSKGMQLAEVISDQLIIQRTADALDLLGNVYYQGFDSLILYKKNIIPDFFDLKNGLAGEILQKFSNYRMRLAIVGDFSNYTNKSIKDFILESNQSGHINFVSTLEEALDKLSAF
jgi:hypothetical protein